MSSNFVQPQQRMARKLESVTPRHKPGAMSAQHMIKQKEERSI
jgi:hypothetical protein